MTFEEYNNLVKRLSEDLDNKTNSFILCYSIEEIKCIFKELKIQIKDNFDYMCDKMKIYKIWDCGQVKVTTYVD